MSLNIERGARFSRNRNADQINTRLSDLFDSNTNGDKRRSRRGVLKTTMQLLATSTAAGLIIGSGAVAVAEETINQLPVSPGFNELLDSAIRMPRNYGNLSIRKIDNTPATIIMAGDSLARGYGSNKTSGLYDTIGYYMVNRANQVDNSVAKYGFVKGLTQNGISVEETTQRLQKHRKELMTIPNLVLILSFTNRSIQDFLGGAVKLTGLSKIQTTEDVVQLLENDSHQYQKELKELMTTLNSIYKQRTAVLGKSKGAMQALVLGIPDILNTPKAQKLLEQHHIKYGYGLGNLVIDIYNTDDQHAAQLEDQERGTLKVSFVDLANIHLPSQILPRLMFRDGFHPNATGYEYLTQATEKICDVTYKTKDKRKITVVYLARK